MPAETVNGVVRETLVCPMHNQIQSKPLIAVKPEISGFVSALLFRGGFIAFLPGDVPAELLLEAEAAVVKMLGLKSDRSAPKAEQD